MCKNHVSNPNKEIAKEPVVVWQQQSGERSSQLNELAKEPVNYVHSLCYDYLTQDKFCKTERIPTLNQTELTTTATLHDLTNTSTAKYDPRNNPCALKCSEPLKGMPSLNAGSPRNPSYPRENLDVSSFPECLTTHTDDSGHGSDNPSNLSNLNCLNTNSEVSSKSKSNSRVQDDKKTEMCHLPHVGIQSEQSESKNERKETEKCPFLRSGTLQESNK